MENTKKVYYGIVSKTTCAHLDVPTQVRCAKEETRLGMSLLNYYLSLLGEKFGTIQKTPQGKPFFVENHIHFNYAHTKDYIACAISGVEVGIDIEHKDRKISNRLAHLYLDQIEDSQQRLLKWVHHEARAKVLGISIFEQMREPKPLRNHAYLEIEDSNYWSVVYGAFQHLIFERIEALK